MASVGAGGRRRRFAQDAQIPVAVPNGRRYHTADAPINRLEVTETAAAERAAREKAEQALAVAQVTIYDLQTQQEHGGGADRVAAATETAREQRLSPIEAAYAEATSRRTEEIAHP